MIYGKGINDADYVVQPTINGKRFPCPFYKTWNGVLQRCYSRTFKKRRPTYEKVYCSEDWLTFSNFKSWMENQPYQDCELDKDILFLDNTLYSAETCVFVPSFINNLFLDSKKIRGEYPLGVNFHKGVGKLVSQIKINNVKKHLGYFDDISDAHKNWQIAKCCAMSGAVTTWKNGGYPSYSVKVADCILARVEKIYRDFQSSIVTEEF